MEKTRKSLRYRFGETLRTWGKKLEDKADAMEAEKSAPAKKKKYSMPRIRRASSFYPSTFALGLSTGLIFLTGNLVYIHLIEGSYLLALGFVGATIGAVARTIRDLDQRALGRTLENKASLFNKIVFKLLAPTPLRVLSVNRMLMRVERLNDQDQLKSSEKAERERERNRAEKIKNPPLSAEIRDERTFQYIKKQADKRKHLMYILPAFLAIFAGIRMVANLDTATSVLQIGSRVVGYAFGAGFAIAQVDAYVLRRSREKNPRPLIKLSQKALSVLPTRLWSRWILKRNLQNYHDILAGKQPLMRRIQRMIYDEIPIMKLSLWMMARHDKYNYVWNDAVAQKLAGTEVLPTMDDLAQMLDKPAPEPVIVKDDSLKLRKAWQDFMSENEQNRQKLQVEFTKYKGKIEAEIDLLKFVKGKKPNTIDERMNWYIPSDPAPVEQGGTLLAVHPTPVKDGLTLTFNEVETGLPSMVVMTTLIVHPMKGGFQPV